MPRSACRREAAALGLALGLVTLFWNPLLWPGRVYPSGDLTNLFWPQRVILAQSIAQGVVPLWNPHVWAGSPFHAAMQAGVFDPAAWPFLWGRGPVSLLDGFDGQRLLLLLVFCASVYALARAGVGVGRGGAALAATALPCCGFVWGHFDHVNQLSAMTWFPLALLGALRAARGEPGRNAALIGFAVGMQLLAGHPQHAVLGGVSVAVVCASLLAGSPWVRWAGAVRVIGGGYLLGALLGAVQLLPALELSRLSERPFDPPDYATSFSMEWRHLLRLVWPFAFGEFPHYSAPDNFSELGLFVGRVPLALALVAALGLAPRRWALAFAGLALVAVLWALGSNGPLLEPLLAMVPPLRGFRVPPRMLFHLDLALALLAALGLDAALRRLGGGGCAVRRRGGLVAAALLLTLGDLWATSRRDYIRQPAEAAGAQAASPALGPMVAGGGRVFRLQRDDGNYYIDPRPLAMTRRLERLQPNLGALWGISDIEGYTEGLLPTARWRTLLGALHRNLHQAQPDARALALLGVRWVLNESSIWPITPDPLRPVLTFGYDEEGQRREFTLFENPLALPPVVPRRVLEGLVTPGILESLWRLPAPMTLGDPIALARQSAPWPEPDSLPRLPLHWETVNVARIDNPAGFAGEAVVVQGAHPGWIVEDGAGNRETLQPLGAAWSAFEIEEGVAVIRLRFEPVSFSAGFRLSLAGMLILSLLAARPAAGSARRRAPAPAQSAGCDTGTH